MCEAGGKFVLQWIWEAAAIWPPVRMNRETMDGGINGKV